MAINGLFIPFHSEYDDELEDVEETKVNTEEESQDDSEELEETEEESQDDSEELEESEEVSQDESQVDSISSERIEEEQESTEETENDNISQDDSDSETSQTIAYTVSCNGYSIDFDSNSISCFLLASILGAVLCVCFFGRLKTL